MGWCMAITTLAVAMTLCMTHGSNCKEVGQVSLIFRFNGLITATAVVKQDLSQDLSEILWARMFSLLQGSSKPLWFQEGWSPVSSQNSVSENTEDCKVWGRSLYLLLCLADNSKYHPIYCNPSIIVFSVNIWANWTNARNHQVGQSLDPIPLFSQPSLPIREVVSLCSSLLGTNHMDNALTFVLHAKVGQTLQVWFFIVKRFGQ